jgi:hypothetical protein
MGLKAIVPVAACLALAGLGVFLAASPAREAAACNPREVHIKRVEVYFGTGEQFPAGKSDGLVLFGLALSEKVPRRLAEFISGTHPEPRVSGAIGPWADDSLSEAEWFGRQAEASDPARDLLYTIAALPGPGEPSVGQPIFQGAVLYPLATWETDAPGCRTLHEGFAEVTYYERNVSLRPDPMAIVRGERRTAADLVRLVASRPDLVSETAGARDERSGMSFAAAFFRRPLGVDVLAAGLGAAGFGAIVLRGVRRLAPPRPAGARGPRRGASSGRGISPGSSVLKRGGQGAEPPNGGLGGRPPKSNHLPGPMGGKRHARFVTSSAPWEAVRPVRRRPPP